MNRLPVMVGLGGINSAGRVSFNHAYHRMVIDTLSQSQQDQTWWSLAQLMGLNTAAGQAAEHADYIRQHTLVRRIELWDPEQVYWQSGLSLADPDQDHLSFVLRKRQLPDPVPAGWQVEPLDDKQVRVKAPLPLEVMLPEMRPSRVTSAGQLPTGFDPGALYASRNHPRGLQMTVFGASDALQSTGFTIDQLKAMVRPDEFAVYSGSAMAQLDDDGYGGLLQNPLRGKRPTSKQIALGLPGTTGDFINAYVLGSVGETAGIIGACATFLYNVKRGIDDIRSGHKRIVVVGNSEAPILPHIIEGYRTMGALAEDEALMALDNSDVCDNRRACRPFSSNAGFTVAEASVYLVLMDDELAMEQGARVLGSVGGVFVNADGYKKSISGPGVGNYVTVAKCMAAARAILGEDTLRNGTYMQAHGTGTPQNRVTESHIFSELAGVFGISDWLVGAVKSYLGHSMAPAGGDQLSAIVGAWNHGVIPGITTIDHIADDVHQTNLRFPFEHVEEDPKRFAGAFVNSKGFGGNNATGLFLSPDTTLEMLQTRWGKDQFLAWSRKTEAVTQQALDYDAVADSRDTKLVYEFGERVITPESLEISAEEMRIPGFEQPVSLRSDNPWADMFKDQ